MADVFVEWTAEGPGDRCGLTTLEMLGCAELHRVRWQESFVAESGRRLICHFEAPDAESVRLALRLAHLHADAIWSGRVFDGETDARANAVVEHDFATPPADAAAALAVVEAERLRPNGLRLVRALVSSDRRRVICACALPADAAAPGVDEAGTVWPCRRVAA